MDNAYLQRLQKFLMKCFGIDYFFIDHHSFQGIFSFLLDSFIGITTSGNKFLLIIVLLKDLLKHMDGKLHEPNLILWNNHEGRIPVTLFRWILWNPHLKNLDANF